MKTFLAILYFLLSAHLSYGSVIYADTSGGASQIQLAVQGAFGNTAGVGGKEGSCLLCHASSSGGPGNINIGFGWDFVIAARAVGASANGGGQQVLPMLERIFEQPEFAAKDSDNDGLTNEEEMSLNQDPASDVVDGADPMGATSGSSSTCGRISTTGQPSWALFLLLLFPFLIAFHLKRRSFSSLKK